MTIFLDITIRCEVSEEEVMGVDSISQSDLETAFSNVNGSFGGLKEDMVREVNRLLPPAEGEQGNPVKVDLSQAASLRLERSNKFVQARLVLQIVGQNKIASEIANTYF